MLAASTSVAMMAADIQLRRTRPETCSLEGPAVVTDKSHLDGRASRSHHIALHQRRRNRGRAMNNDAASFIGNIPEHYDSGLGPTIFADYAADIARRAAACSPARVLETAAGTGTVSANYAIFCLSACI